VAKPCSGGQAAALGSCISLFPSALFSVRILTSVVCDLVLRALGFAVLCCSCCCFYGFLRVGVYAQQLLFVAAALS
jgi:hypothetical protein